MKEAILVPAFAMPKKDLGNPCPCQDRPVKLTYKTGILIWVKKIGDSVKKGEVICEGEVEKKTLELCAPCDGYLLEKCVPDNEEFKFGEILGYIGDTIPQKK